MSYPPVLLSILCMLLPLPSLLCAETGDSKTGTGELSALEQRILIERETRYQAFVITPHKPNYLLPLTYNSQPNNAPVNVARDGALDEVEVKFQFSMKYSIAEDLFGEQGSLQFAYTNLSFWQAYNHDASSPFRETVHEPELFFTFPYDGRFLGMTSRLIQIGVVHQSNGRAAAQSRSWNRVYADFIFQYGDFYLSLKPWHRFEGSWAGEDDNPDIETYLGKGELRLVYASNQHTVSMLLRNNLRSPNYGAVELNWSFPMSRRVKWFFQYFDGYGESLIDYNARVQRLGIGLAFTDWL
ncbi:MAG: phospholipase A [Gammaproteobacteria bacterium]